MAKFKKWALVVAECIWTLFAICLVYYVLVVVGGCAAGDPLTQRDRAERTMLACKRADGIWIHPEGRVLSGKCNWNRRIF